MKISKLALTIICLIFATSIYSEENWNGLVTHQEAYDWEYSHTSIFDISIENGVYKELILVGGVDWQPVEASLSKEDGFLEGNHFFQVLFLLERSKRKRNIHSRGEIPNSSLENSNIPKLLLSIQLDWRNVILSNGYRDSEIIKYLTRLKGSDPNRNTKPC